MLYGIVLFYKVLNISEKLIKEYLDIFKEYFKERIECFELLDNETAKGKKVRDFQKLIEEINTKRYFSLLATSKRSENFSFSIDLERDENAYLSQISKVYFEIKNHSINLFKEICARFLILNYPAYCYGLYHEDFIYLGEEISCIPISNSWQTGKTNHERENYLLSLQRMRVDIGKVIPQLYPINFFSNTLDPLVCSKFEKVLNEKWEVHSAPHGKIIQIKDNSSWDEFYIEQQRINQELGISFSRK